MSHQLVVVVAVVAFVGSIPFVVVFDRPCSPSQ